MATKKRAQMTQESEWNLTGQMAGDTMTIEEAACLLDVPVAMLPELMVGEEIPLMESGGQAYLSSREVWAWQQRRKAQRIVALQEMARLDQEMGLYE